MSITALLMKKNDLVWKHFIVICFLICLSSPAIADVNETGKITRIITEGDQWVSVWLDGQDDTTECSGGSKWTISKKNDPMFKEKMSVLLTAALTKKVVRLRHISAWGCGGWDSNRIYYIDIDY